MKKGLIGRKPNKIKKKNKGYLFLIGLSIIIFTVFVVLVKFDNKLFPIALKYLESDMVTVVNIVINESTTDIINDMDLKSSDFYEKTESPDGKINSMEINAILINKVCGRVAEDISVKLHEIGPQEISVPIGALSEIKSFANLGPSYSISILPMGNAYVDYSSSFESVGINQVNFQVWLKVDTKVKVVNPLQSKEITISRKIPLVNTIINSEVPNTYFNTSK